MFGKQTKSIVATEMGYVTVTGHHDAVKCHLKFVRYHARNSKPVPLGPDASECVGPREEVAMSAGRSQDWIARNLGDVPHRHTGGLWELVVAVGIDGPLPTRAPVESLGRDA